MFGRQKAKTHGQQMRTELSEGFGHLWRAAAHAASGVGATVGPKWDSARDHLPPSIGKARHLAASGVGTTIAAILPLVAAARAGAEDATKRARMAKTKESGMSRRRKKVLIGLLAAGAAAGAAGAVMARRRNRAKWDEYEREGIQTARDSARSALDSARSTMEAGAQRVAGAAERAGQSMSGRMDSARDSTDAMYASTKETTNLFADQAAHAAGQAAARAGEAMEHGKSKTDQFADKAATISKNSRN